MFETTNQNIIAPTSWKHFKRQFFGAYYSYLRTSTLDVYVQYWAQQVTRVQKQKYASMLFLLPGLIKNQGRSPQIVPSGKLT